MYILINRINFSITNIQLNKEKKKKYKRGKRYRDTKGTFTITTLDNDAANEYKKGCLQNHITLYHKRYLHLENKYKLQVSHAVTDS